MITNFNNQLMNSIQFKQINLNNRQQFKMKKRSNFSKSRNLSKKQQTKKISKHLSTHIESKATNKKKVKSSNQQCKDFIISDGRVIMIKTQTERDKIEDLIHTMKSENKMSSSKNQKYTFKKNINDIQEIVRSLSKSQKLQTIKKLESDLKIPPRVHIPNLDPLDRLDKKLQKVKMQLHFKWEAQQQKIMQMFYEGTLNEKAKQQKNKMINRLKQHKIKIIDCTRDLFRSILKNQNEQQSQPEGLDDILKSLNSFSSFETFPDVQNANQMWEATSQMKIEQNQMISIVEASMTSPSKKQKDLQHQKYAERVRLAIQVNSIQCQTVSSDLIQPENSPKKQLNPIQPIGQDQFPTDLRIQLKQKCDLNDQLQIFKHKITPKDVINKNKQNQSYENFHEIQQQANLISLTHPINQISQASEQLLLSPALQKQKIHYKEGKQSETGKQSKVKSHIDDHDPDSGITINMKFKIPTLMTKDKLQQLQMQKRVKEVQLFKQTIQRRIAIQLSCMEEEGQHTFTTLADVNNYIVNLYEFITSNFSMQVVNSLNTPYGKSVLDKLFNLQNSGAESEDEYNNVFQQQFFGSHQKQMTVTFKESSEYERIHCKALFNAFNDGLNAFRPYFQIEGQVYPWMVSQKGITFYQINQQNIEQVFEKTKIKVLEHCSCLCGLQSNEHQLGSQQRQILKAKREQLEKKCFQSQIKEQFKSWDLKMMNYQTMCRLIVAETIFNQELLFVVAQMARLT